MKINTDPKKIKGVLERGIERVIEKEELIKKLSSGKPLRIKHGLDPTGPKIHIGRAIQLWKLRDFQEMGHQIVLIVGDFTARIGDASDKQAMRKSLTGKEIRENMKDYETQIGKIIDIKKAEVRYNSEWLEKMNMKDLLFLSMGFTAQQMIHRRNFKERWEQKKPIGLHELLYPLLQGYDSVAVKADAEIGGFDQLFNLTTGRDIQKMFNQPAQDIMVSKMLFGLDGRKMSTSWGNIITILDPLNEMYGKIMSMQDNLIYDYFELCTRISTEELKKIKTEIKKDPRAAKARLAKTIVSLYWGERKALEAEKEFNRVFREKKLPVRVPEIKIKRGSLNILDLLVQAKLASSKTEAKRLVLQKAIKINNILKTDWKENIKLENNAVIKAGKRKFLKIKLVN